MNGWSFSQRTNIADRFVGANRKPDLNPCGRVGRKTDGITGVTIPARLVLSDEITYHLRHKVINVPAHNNAAARRKCLGRMHLLKFIGEIAIALGVHI